MSEDGEAQQGLGCLLLIILLAGGLYLYRTSVMRYVHHVVAVSDKLDEEAAARRTPARSAQTVAPDRSLTFLYRFNEKDPSSVNLLRHPRLRARLQKLLGSQYTYLKSIWEVETPIEIEDGLLYAWGMQAHGGGNPGAVIMADIETNVLYVGIRRNHRVRLYAENGEEVPARLQEWANDDEQDAEGRDI